MYKLKITSRAEKELKQISKLYQRQAFNEALKEIKEDPFIGKPLEDELFGEYSMRVGVYRIIYRINDNDKVINIVSAGHRSVIYKR